ncbi:very short patch repair endonuclease [Solwaraspora sp. WMMD406]|uniref:very short patch repair endonuclease n=1 Tax=Solwaraspora sp. WMMD406 TaxID=3016095 RepID=UPI0024160DFC|nr:very short patch repair endonuclease [Solwaraspora sp. WMMD406]MDG4763619.1 very short patch repair endonuclease [Solwaraspora sp. WMMD406]
MKPPASSAGVSDRMRKQKSFDTELELSLRRKLYQRGLRYRVHSQAVPGTRRTIDIAFLSAKVAVFLDGCFWHGCPIHGTSPKANSKWWADKISENQRRDVDTNRRMENAGWLVVRVWGHQDLERAAAEVERIVRERRPLRKPVEGSADSASHGTVSAYRGSGCRCQECKSANAVYQRQLRNKYRSEGGRGQHGTDYRYRTGCRCDACRSAHAAEDRAYRERRRLTL